MLTPEQIAAAKSAVGQTAEQAATNVPKQYDGNNNPVTQTTAAPAQQRPLTAEETARLSLSNKDVDSLDAAKSAIIGSYVSKFGRLNADDAASVTAGSAQSKITAAGSGNSSSGTESSKTAQNVAASTLTNRLHDFTSYTYKITLFLLTKDDFTEISKNPKAFVPKHVLISSAGGLPIEADASTKATWHPDFQEDFFIDNLTMTTVVGLNAKSRASNAIELKFNIIEPYGLSLLDRLLSACQVTAKSQNYMDQPYLLQIDFISNTDEIGTAGTFGNVIDRKRIAVRFIDFGIRPGSGGTTYSITAIPYHHSGFFETVSSTQTAVSVVAKTVKEFFDSVDTPEELASNPPSYKNTSYAGAYNTFYKNLVAANRAKFPPNTIKFHIDKAIADSVIVEDNPDVTTTPQNAQSSSAKVGMAGGTSPDYKNRGTFSIGASTSIIGIIDRIVGSSSYIKNQIRLKEEEALAAQAQANPNANRSDTTPESQKKPENSPTQWYKVIPSVELGEYDDTTGMYSKVITYSVVPYTAANFRHPDIKKTRVTRNQVVRAYNYYYTGLNQDIISMDINFDATFYTSVTPYVNKVGQLKSTPEVNHQEGAIDKEPSDPTNKNFQTQVAATGIEQGTTGAGFDKGTRVSVASVTRSLYSAYPSGDMLNVKLRITGDPAFIKQDDLLYRPSQPTYASFIKKGNGDASPPVNDDGQVIFDAEEVYIQLLIKNAVDIDDNLGIVNKQVKLLNGTMTNGSFSGIYRVLSVTTEISKGKFEQVLDIIRVPDEMVDGLNSPSASVKSPTNTVADSGASGARPPSLPGIQTDSDVLAIAANGSPVPTVGSNVLAQQKALDAVALARTKKVAAEAASISSPSEENRKLAELANAQYQSAYATLRSLG